MLIKESEMFNNEKLKDNLFEIDTNLNENAIIATNVESAV